ncbi:iron-siderophore ABC transporter substrate-binding protein [Dactylosporangium fulvum]|uniref:ABC transporter substrate-binding protein n=1 Tax=Dactylosporangium fulvum TaxID=53359 RepID=A0ABY5W090_9ACTN|nr:ABC transporter substrate-binding protein [Dactylosporangium fulvum]UWP82138.1 ABC transporter substrate-binding protein [Dactylosporangium fulvum]
MGNAPTVLTRRGLLAGGLGAATLLGLAACGSSDTPSPAGGSQAAAGTRKIDTAKGTIEVPAQPARVVTIQPSATASLYDLGVSPVGVYDQGAEYISPRYRDRWSAATKIGNAGQIDLEKVAALRPDLIIGVDFPWNTKVYDQLTALAPTVITPTTWRATARVAADAVNRLGRVSELEQQMTTRADTIKSTYAAVLGRFRWAILQGGFDQGQFWVYGPGSDAGTILAAAGVQFATASAGVSGSGNQPFSYERIDALADADVIGFYTGYDGKPNNEGPKLFAQPAFNALRAVKAGRLVPIPDFLPGGYGDALAVLDELETGLRELQSAA